MHKHLELSRQSPLGPMTSVRFNSAPWARHKSFCCELHSCAPNSESPTPVHPRYKHHQVLRSAGFSNLDIRVRYRTSAHGPRPHFGVRSSFGSYSAILLPNERLLGTSALRGVGAKAVAGPAPRSAWRECFGFWWKEGRQLFLAPAIIICR